MRPGIIPALIANGWYTSDGSEIADGLTGLVPVANGAWIANGQLLANGLLDDIEFGLNLIRTAKENPPDDWVLWLIWEFGLDELLPYLPEPRVALNNGLQWQPIRGTPASLLLAFSWIGFADADVSEETPTDVHWYEYQVNPGKVPSQDELEKIVGLARLSAPIGTRLSRIYYGYDMRRAVYDETAWCDGTLWSDHSGVYDPDLGVDISFGRTHYILPSPPLANGDWIADGTIIANGNVVASGISFTTATRENTQQLVYNDVNRWDMDDYDDLPGMRNYTLVREYTSQVVWQGAGRNLSVADGTAIADGTVPSAGIAVTEQPQYAATHIVDDLATERFGWARSTGWDGRTWTDPAF